MQDQLNFKAQQSVKFSKKFKFLRKLSNIVEKAAIVFTFVKNSWRLLDKFGFIVQAWNKGKQKVEDYFNCNEAADMSFYTAAVNGRLIDFATMTKEQILYLLKVFGVNNVSYQDLRA
jgi:hypothetical protein